MPTMLTEEQLQEKWSPVIDYAKFNPIDNSAKKADLSLMLENTEEMGRGGRTLTETVSALPANYMGASSSTAGSGGIDTYDPIMVSMIRRNVPNLISYDICGTQVMTGPTGLIFAARSRYTSQTGPENFYNEVNTAFSSVTTGANTFGQAFTGSFPGNSNTTPLTSVNTYNTGTGTTLAIGETIGTDGGPAFPQMALSIEKVQVTALTRKLKAEWTREIAQDMKAIHGLDMKQEMINLLSTEMVAEINREILRTVNLTAVAGATGGAGAQTTATAGVFDLDTDSNGRWMGEKFQGMIFQIEMEANAIAKNTRRGRGNIMIVSSNVASALNMAGKLTYAPSVNSNNLQIDDTGNTYAGVLSNNIKVYIDPYVMGGDYFTVGFKGADRLDAGLFYCPYVPLQLMQAIDQGTFDPKIGFQTRYGIVANPFAGGLVDNRGALLFGSNQYYRRVVVNNIA